MKKCELSKVSLQIDWVVGIVTRYGLNKSGFGSRQGQCIFLISKTSWPRLGSTKLFIQSAPGLFPRVKAVRCEVCHWPPAGAEVKNKWKYISLRKFLLSVKRHNFTLFWILKLTRIVIKDFFPDIFNERFSNIITVWGPTVQTGLEWEDLCLNLHSKTAENCATLRLIKLLI
jgi:hypothetical protein